MPVDMGKLIPEEFVVELFGVEDLREGLGCEGHFFHQLNPFGRCEVEQLGRVPCEDDHGPAGEKLIVVEIGFREAKVGNKMIGLGPGPVASFTRRVGHGCMTFRHSSSVINPFLSNNWSSFSVCLSV